MKKYLQVLEAAVFPVIKKDSGRFMIMGLVPDLTSILLFLYLLLKILLVAVLIFTLLTVGYVQYLNLGA